MKTPLLELTQKSLSNFWVYVHFAMGFSFYGFIIKKTPRFLRRGVYFLELLNILYLLQ